MFTTGDILTYSRRRYHFREFVLTTVISPLARVEPRVEAALDDSNVGNLLITIIMERVPEASFGIMKTMGVTLLGWIMIMKI